MNRTFKVMGEDLYFDGQLVATFSSTAWGSLRDEVKALLDGMPYDVTPTEEVEREREKMEEEHVDEIQANYDYGHAEGLGEGHANGYEEGLLEGYERGYADGVRNADEEK